MEWISLSTVSSYPCLNFTSTSSRFPFCGVVVDGEALLALVSGMLF